MTHLPMSPKMRRKYAFPGSVYERPCPQCGAQPFEWCVKKNGKPRPGDKFHSTRSASPIGQGTKGHARHRNLGF